MNRDEMHCKVNPIFICTFLHDGAWMAGRMVRDCGLKDGHYDSISRVGQYEPSLLGSNLSGLVEDHRV
jgi:hypothetical protein